MELLPVLDLPEPDPEPEVTIEHTDLTDTSTESKDIFINAPRNEENLKTIPKKTKRVRIAEIATLLESEDEAEDCDYHAPPEEKKEEENIVISPKPKPKKPKSEKQLAHLKRIRVLAAEKKRATKLEKVAMEKMVKEQLKKKKLAQDAEDEKFTEDFRMRMNIPSDEQLAKSQREKEENMYKDFLLNMKKYKHHKDIHRPTPSAPPPPTPAKKPTPIPVAPINIKPDNPFSRAFDW